MLWADLLKRVFKLDALCCPKCKGITLMEVTSDEAVLVFVERVGKFATYPYFRAHCSQLSWESGADLPILPVIST